MATALLCPLHICAALQVEHVPEAFNHMSCTLAAEAALSSMVALGRAGTIVFANGVLV